MACNILYAKYNTKNEAIVRGEENLLKAML
jgi:hypothetical protein